MRFSLKGADLAALAKRVVEGGEIRESDLRSGGWGRRMAESRRLVCQLAVKKMGYPGAEVGRFWGVTTSAVNKAASSAEVSEIGNYLKLFRNERPPFRSVTTAPARLDSRPVANGYLDRLPTYKTMQPCQAATKGVPIPITRFFGGTAGCAAGLGG